MVRSFVLILAACLTGGNRHVKALMDPSWTMRRRGRGVAGVRRRQGRITIAVVPPRRGGYDPPGRVGARSIVGAGPAPVAVGRLGAYYSDFSSAGGDDGCASDEECEIDWDQMPGLGGHDDSSSSSSTTQSPPPATTETAGGTGTPSSDDDKKQTKPSTSSVTTASSPSSGGGGGPNSGVESLRKRLEMSWRMAETAEECDVYRPATCGGSPCRVCRTSGRMPCRFCHGRSYNERLQSVCPICDERGLEVCSNCRGSGWIADWTAHGIRSGAAGMGPGSSESSSATGRGGDDHGLWSQLAP